MAQTFIQIVSNILKVLYQLFLPSLLITVFSVFVILYVREHGWNEAWQNICNTFHKDKIFKRECLLTFYVGLILFRTLLDRKIWMNPLSNVLGNWTLRYPDGSLSTEPIENIILFVPYLFLLLGVLWEKIENEQKILPVVRNSLKISFFSSLLIEISQLVFHLGTFQLSDLFYNVVGGVIGGISYWGWKKIRRHQSRKK